MKNDGQLFLKPSAYTENKLLAGIIDGTFRPGDFLPSERALAREIGVTRPTLREALQRISREGWVTIRHGKPTRVNNYLEQGGLAVLGALVRFGERLPAGTVSHLLEARACILPEVAGLAVEKDAEALEAYLLKSAGLTDDPGRFARYDWGLQMQMVRTSRNPVFNMIFNDFTPLYKVLGDLFFQDEAARLASMDYYRRLLQILDKGRRAVTLLVRQVMSDTHKTWEAAYEAR